MAIRANHRHNLETRWGADDICPNAHGKLMILGRPSFQWNGAPSPEAFYKGFWGFDEVHTLDVSTYQGASHSHDLNKPLPAELAGRYDMVISGGTLEHVFDVANALRCLAGLAKVGGMVMCGAPANNWMDHGFYQLSPTLKFDYFHANDWEFMASRGTMSDPKTTVTRSFPLYPGEVSRWNAAGCRFNHLCAARRTEQSTIDRIPLQGVDVYLHGGQPRKFRFRTTTPVEVDKGVKAAPPEQRFTLADPRPMLGSWGAPFQNLGIRPRCRSCRSARPRWSTRMADCCRGSCRSRRWLPSGRAASITGRSSSTSRRATAVSRAGRHTRWCSPILSGWMA